MDKRGDFWQNCSTGSRPRGSVRGLGDRTSGLSPFLDPRLGRIYRESESKQLLPRQGRGLIGEDTPPASVRIPTLSDDHRHWPSARRRRRVRELRALQKNPGRREVVLFADEVDIHLNPRIGRDWMLPGQQKLVLTPGQNQKAFIAGAYDPRTGRIVCVDGDRKAVWLFLNLLRALLQVYRSARRIHLILDNYVIHKSELVAAFLRTVGQKIQLHFLPPYCPEENRIERLWKDVHDNVTRNHRCGGLQELLDRVYAYLASRFQVRWGASQHPRET